MDQIDSNSNVVDFAPVPPVPDVPVDAPVDAPAPIVLDALPTIEATPVPDVPVDAPPVPDVPTLTPDLVSSLVKSVMDFDNRLTSFIETYNDATADIHIRLNALEEKANAWLTPTQPPAPPPEVAPVAPVAPVPVDTPAPANDVLEVGMKVKITGGDWGNNKGEIIEIDYINGNAFVSFGWTQGVVEIEHMEAED